jgi:hypothetical protein
MTLADVLAVSAAVAASCAGLAALFLLIPILFPLAVERARTATLARKISTGLLGAVAFFGLLFVFAVITKAAQGPVRLIGLVVFLFGLVLFAIGGAALAGELGRRLRHRSSTDMTSTALGTGVLFLSSLLPLLGWFVVLPCAASLFLGAGIRGLSGSGSVAPVSSVPAAV